MVYQQTENNPQHLEHRVATLEAELAQLKQLLANLLKQDTPPWLQIVGSAEHDPTFEEAVRLGREWRQSAE